MWYREGTITFTKGSDTLEGTGTFWNVTANGVLPGMIVIGPDNRLYEIKRVLNDTRLTLMEQYTGETQNEVPCRIITTYEGDLTQFSARFTALMTRMSADSKTMRSWLTAIDEVTLEREDGTEVTVKSLTQIVDEHNANQKWYTDNADVINAAGDKAREAAASAAAAAESANTASTKATEASQSAAAAAASENAAGASASAAKTSETNAESFKVEAAASAATASTKATEAGESATSAAASKDAAKASETQAATSASEASASASAASDSAAAAKTSETNASASEQAAAGSAADALASKNAAKESETHAASSAGESAASAAAAKTSETNADASQKAAAASESAAASSANAASESATAAGESADAALASKNAAASSEQKAKTSETNAKASETAASESATAAEASKAAAQNSEAHAVESAAAAAGSADAASKSATAAADSATTATEKANVASEQATASEASAAAAKTSETNAKSAETAAEGSATAAAKSAGEAAASATTATEAMAVAEAKAKEASDSAALASTKATEATDAAAGAKTSELNAKESETKAYEYAQNAQASVASVKWKGTSAEMDMATDAPKWVKVSTARMPQSTSTVYIEVIGGAGYEAGQPGLAAMADIVLRTAAGDPKSLNAVAYRTMDSAVLTVATVNTTDDNYDIYLKAGAGSQKLVVNLQSAGAVVETLEVLEVVDTLPEDAVEGTVYHRVISDQDGSITGSLVGNASTATVLQTARHIGGVSFDGSTDINLPGVNIQGNQNTTGNAATATKLQTPRTINSVTFDGSANITIPTLVSRGRISALEGNVQGAMPGIQMYEAYNNGYPTSYGNILHMKGAQASGEGELLVGWSGSDGAHAPVYIRSRRDTVGANWSGWAQVYTTAHKPSARDVGAMSTTTLSFNGGAGWFKIATVTMPQSTCVVMIRMIGGAGYNTGTFDQATISELVLRAGNNSPKGITAVVWRRSTQGINGAAWINTSGDSYDIYVNLPNYATTLNIQWDYTSNAGVRIHSAPAYSAAQPEGATIAQVHNLYSTLIKPTPTEIGALPLSGGTMTGVLTLQNVSQPLKTPGGGILANDGNLYINKSGFTGWIDALFMKNSGGTMSGPLKIRATDGLRIYDAAYGMIFRRSENNFYLIPTAKDQGENGAIGSLRPFYLDLTNGRVTMGNGAVINGGLGLGVVNGLGGNSIVLGDNDTGFKQNGDGILDVYANSAHVFRFVNGTLQSLKPLSVSGDITSSAWVYANRFSINSSSGSWIDMRNQNVIFGRNAVSTSSAQALLRQDHADRKFFVGGLGNSQFGFYMINNSRTANGTDAQAYLQNDGTWVCGGNGSFNDVYIRSDRRSKRNIRRIERALDKLDRIEGVLYEIQVCGRYEQSGGLIAQDVQNVQPELVTVDHNDQSGEPRLRLNYNGVIGMLVEAVKELREEVRELKARM
ncbi:tail fiber domain-containing protein [Enterobacter hormaechei]|uniref:tail fiber domain-containing protein n=1 Tax=unclassified Enterobacter cloacae complex TaxID=2757714 RepID=UPI00100E64BF|nr:MULTISPECIES: tail fiber domain-containing protein [unclassified Enterobacter cloacae complex]EKW8986125.1 tail fiber domain-containing protein [Enterobacter hormaechei]RYA69672.1 phage tail protein [Enterobacter cloacae complex sp. 2DZ2F16B1]EKY4856623.1 tail fiber domain-containing protein [Enterobacter hormaechei]ELD7979129.1 tail fiber domain-containing protein [Enterobacter hormaechei]EMA2242263.1 tail fiber domain-containing protein [Enterobacter hormaechei]